MGNGRPISELTFISSEEHLRLDIKGGPKCLTCIYRDEDGVEYYELEVIGDNKDLYIVFEGIYNTGEEYQDIMLKTDYEELKIAQKD